MISKDIEKASVNYQMFTEISVTLLFYYLIVILSNLGINVFALIQIHWKNFSVFSKKSIF